MGVYSSLRICFYRYCEMPNDENYQTLKEAKEKFEKVYGVDEVKRVLQEAQLAIDQEKLKISPHLPYSCQ